MSNVEVNPYNGMEFNIGGAHIFLNADLTQEARGTAIASATMQLFMSPKNFTLLNFAQDKPGYNKATQEECMQRISKALGAEIPSGHGVYKLPADPHTYSAIADVLMQMQMERASKETFVNAQFLRQHPEIKIVNEVAEHVAVPNEPLPLKQIHALKTFEAQIERAIDFSTNTMQHERPFPEESVKDLLDPTYKKVVLPEAMREPLMKEIIHQIRTASEIVLADRRQRGT